MNRSAKISDILKPLKEATSQAYISNALQVADIAEWIIAQSDAVTCEKKRLTKRQREQFNALPVDVHVFQTTFSISEEFLRRMYFIKLRYRASFSVVIDRKALMKTVSLWRFIVQVYDRVYIADNHSKILLIEAPGMNAAVVTSQNLTRGNRAESAVVSSDSKIFFSLLRDFNDLCKYNSAPMTQLMNSNSNHQESAQQAPPTVEEQISALAENFCSISDIATVLDIPAGRLRARIADDADPWSIAYHVGKTKAKVAIKAQEMQLARVGSPLGMQSVRENLIIMEADE